MGEDETDAIPESALDEAVRLTKLARLVGGSDDLDDAPPRGMVESAQPTGSGGSDPETIRRQRDELLAQFGYIARVREEDEGEVLVCYPDAWMDDQGVVHPDSIDDTSDAIEVQLSGRGEQGDFDTAAAANREIVETVRDEWGEVHAANAAAFADFMSNHYARHIESATATEVEEFISEYYPRNVWPTEAQSAALERSLRYVFEVVEEPYPLE